MPTRRRSRTPLATTGADAAVPASVPVSQPATVPALRAPRGARGIPMARSAPVDVAPLRAYTPQLVAHATGVATAPGKGKQPTAKQLADARGVAAGEKTTRQRGPRKRSRGK